MSNTLKQRMRFSTTYTPHLQTTWAITFCFGLPKKSITRITTAVWKPKQLYWLGSVLLRAPPGASVPQRESLCRQKAADQGLSRRQMYRTRWRYTFRRHSQWLLNSWLKITSPPSHCKPITSIWVVISVGRVQTARPNPIVLNPDWNLIALL